MWRRWKSILVATSIIAVVASEARANPARIARAMQTPRRSLPPRLHDFEVVSDGGGRRWMASGEAATIFRLRAAAGDGKPARELVMRVLDRSAPSPGRRYQAIREHLLSRWPELVAELEFEEQGLKVGGDWHPIVLMPFHSGKNLDQFIADHLAAGGAGAVLAGLAGRFRAMTVRLNDAESSHGDLQHGNLMVDAAGTEIVPIDLDGMYVPALAELGAFDLGHKNYRHPARTRAHYSPEVDNFPALVIYSSLRALAVDPTLWRFYNEHNLILSSEDFLRPTESAAMAAMEASSDPEVARMARALRLLARAPIESVPRLRDLVDDQGRLTEERLADLIASVAQKLAPEPGRIEPVAADAQAAGNLITPASSGLILPTVSAGNRGLIIGLLDGSGSMSEPFDGTTVNKAAALADVWNTFLEQAILRNFRGLQVVDRFDVALFVYSGTTAVSLLPGGREIMSLPELYAAATRVPEQVDGEPVERLVWFQPIANGNTPMAAGHQKVLGLVEKWYPPDSRRLVVMGHVSDGQFNEGGDPRPYSQQIADLVRKRGGVLLRLNVFLSKVSQPHIAFPNPATALDADGQLMRDLSDPVPLEMLGTAEGMGLKIPDGGVLMGQHVGMQQLINLIRLGTDPILKVH
jgi:hypothetical protein